MSDQFDENCIDKLQYVLVEIPNGECDSFKYKDKSNMLGQGFFGKTYQLCCTKDNNCEYIVKIIYNSDLFGNTIQEEIKFQQLSAYFGISPKIISAFRCNDEDYIISNKLNTTVYKYIKTVLYPQNKDLINDLIKNKKLDVTLIDEIFNLNTNIFDVLFSKGIIQFMYEFTIILRLLFNELLCIGIVHNDLHTGNMMFDGKDINTLKIIDYGRAKRINLINESGKLDCEQIHKEISFAKAVNYNINLLNIIDDIDNCFLLRDYLDKLSYKYFLQQVSNDNFKKYYFEPIGSIKEPTNKTIFILSMLVFEELKLNNNKPYNNKFIDKLKQSISNIKEPINIVNAEYLDIGNYMSKRYKTISELNIDNIQHKLELNCEIFLDHIHMYSKKVQEYESKFKQRESTLFDSEMYKKIRSAENIEKNVNKIINCIKQNDIVNIRSIIDLPIPIENYSIEQAEKLIKAASENYEIQQIIIKKFRKGITYNVLSLVNNGKLANKDIKISLINNITDNIITIVKDSLAAKDSKIFSMIFFYNVENWPPELIKHVKSNINNLTIEIPEDEKLTYSKLFFLIELGIKISDEIFEHIINSITSEKYNTELIIKLINSNILQIDTNKNQYYLQKLLIYFNDTNTIKAFIDKYFKYKEVLSSNLTEAILNIKNNDTLLNLILDKFTLSKNNINLLLNVSPDILDILFKENYIIIDNNSINKFIRRASYEQIKVLLKYTACKELDQEYKGYKLSSDDIIKILNSFSDEEETTDILMYIKNYFNIYSIILDKYKNDKDFIKYIKECFDYKINELYSNISLNDIIKMYKDDEYDLCEYMIISHIDNPELLVYLKEILYDKLEIINMADSLRKFKSFVQDIKDRLYSKSN